MKFHGNRRALAHGIYKAGFAAMAASCLPFLCTEAFAQTQAAAQAAEPDSEVVVVTARRRMEALQDTPIAITALSAKALERQQIQTTTDLGKVTPNLQFATYGTLTGNNSAAQVFIRGIGQTDATGAVDPGVGLYIDDVYMGRSVGGAMEFRDIANVQIVRGPQGTLFGRNTIGGAVLLSTNKPGAGNTVRAGIGDDNLKEAFVAFDVPISETLQGRVALGRRMRDGYVHRVSDGLDLGDVNTSNAQGTLRWEPSADLTFTLRGDYAKADEHGSPFVFLQINERQTFPAAASRAAGCPGATFPPPFVPATADPRCANDAQYKGPFTNGGTAPAFSTLENSGLSLVAEWKVNDVLSFKSISSARTLEWSGARDADNTPLLILQTNYSSKSEQKSQEFQAQIKTGQLDGVIGAYYFKEDTFDRVLVGLGNPGTSYDTQRVQLETEATAFFTHWSYKFSDKLSASAGLRYTDESKSLQGVMFNVAPATAAEPAPPTALCPFGGPPPTQTGCLFIGTGQNARNFTATTGSASLQYRWNPALMTYVSWSQGFKSGGFNERYNNAPPGNKPISFAPESAETVEAGFKANPVKGLRVNGAAFSTKYTDMQMTYRLGVVPLLFNAGEATVSGIELEAEYVPVSDLFLNASLGYLKTGFDTITNPPSFGAVTPTSVATLDSRLPFAPELQGHVGAAYTFHPGDGWRLTPRVNISYTDQQYFDAGNTVSIAQNKSVTIVNASIVFEPDDRKWNITLSGNNLTNRLYPLAGTSSESTSAGYAEVIYARPRNINLTYSLNF
ncbi:tonB dependent receptor family protein [Asticcacaulis biprosthecium C19]|uniref:TonB dependent receptor family protein n=1 Tax=Asticcacaulis biprosthecium C19 TaxID=715226 RepID=F4QTC9_9CAUL|nr:TonB-dependent receptor [Asticcacaulis biprosthecium]EGF89999.1 tonB dependent receptor family protein [Asticcacaulis biprosthecium C19]